MEQGLIVERPNGICPVHRTTRINVEGAPHCLVCASEEAKAAAVPYGVVTCADPGHEAMVGLVTAPIEGGKQASATNVHPRLPVAPASLVAKSLLPSPDFNGHVLVAIEHLKKAPMPKDLAQFKAVQRAIATLEKITGAQ